MRALRMDQADSRGYEIVLMITSTPLVCCADPPTVKSGAMPLYGLASDERARTFTDAQRVVYNKEVIVLPPFNELAVALVTVDNPHTLSLLSFLYHAEAGGADGNARVSLDFYPYDMMDGDTDGLMTGEKEVVEATFTGARGASAADLGLR